MHLLIPYIALRPPDPLFVEFTYGDRGDRGRKLKLNVGKGDYIFFHTSKGGKKYITAYYVVERVLDVIAACQEQAIRVKYRNHHLLDYLNGKHPATDDVIVFGDPITSYALEKPLLFDKSLAERLSLNVKFADNITEAQAIVSATRQWRPLTEADITTLLGEIETIRNQSRPKTLRSTEEVSEIIEKDVEDYLADNPELIGANLKLAERQLPIESGRIDLLFEDAQGDLVVVEVKLHRVGRDALRQIQGYMHDFKKREPNKKIRGVLVSAGVMPAYEDDLRKQTDVRVLVYGWDLKVQAW